MKNVKFRVFLVILFLCGIVFVLVKGGFLSGLTGNLSFISYRNGDNDIHSETDGNEDGEDASRDGEEMSDVDARYLQKPIENNVRDKDTYFSYSNSKLAWWFKRNDSHQPSGCDDTLELSDYGAYYLDERANEIVGDDAKESKVIYLTFDCGYENGYTEQILDVLAEQDIPACFFVTKTYIRDNIELSKRMKEDGHQVGNHTITHPSMPDKSYEEIIQEITGCADYMKEAIGYDMDPYLRPPRGEYSARTLMLTHDLGYKTIFWSMAYLDYDVNKQPGKDFVINHFNKYHHNGAIILMHNVSSSNANALETVIVNLKAEGYRFASLNELE